MNPDLDREMSYWCELLGVTPSNGWTVSWRWVDDLSAPSGAPAYGLNEVDGAARSAEILIRKIRTERDKLEFEDTCAHEVVHCLGAHMQALLDAGREVDAHEYLAETLAPAMIKIRNTPRARALAKAVKQLPARAKGNAKMDALQILLALCQGLMGMANLPEEAKALIGPVLEQAGKGSVEAEPPSVEGMPAAADGGDQKPPAVAAAAPLDPGYAKAVDVLLGARPDLSDAQRGFVKTHCKTLDDAASYIGTIPLPAAKAPPAAPKAAAKALDEAPRGGEGSGSKLLSKAKDRLVVAKAMGQATEAKRGPSLIELPGGGGTYFTLGSMTPKEYRAKRAGGWDPRKEFPLASEVGQ